MCASSALLILLLLPSLIIMIIIINKYEFNGFSAQKIALLQNNLVFFRRFRHFLGFFCVCCAFETTADTEKSKIVLCTMPIRMPNVSEDSSFTECAHCTLLGIRFVQTLCDGLANRYLTGQQTDSRKYLSDENETERNIKDEKLNRKRRLKWKTTKMCTAQRFGLPICLYFC